VDIASGREARAYVNELADTGFRREHNPHARVACVDNDPVVPARGRAYLDGLTEVILIPGDLRDPGGILGHPELRRIIDFSQPVALSMTLLLHFVRDEEARTGAWPGCAMPSAPVAGWSSPT
jgi:hypothetical protein